MERLTLLLIVSLFSSSDTLIVYADHSNCVHLECEWRGVGEHCNRATRFHKADELNFAGRYFKFLSKDESDTSILARIKAKYPINTFTLVHYGEVGEDCEERRLWCNVNKIYFEEDYAAFLRRLQKPDTRKRPFFQCSKSILIVNH